MAATLVTILLLHWAVLVIPGPNVLVVMQLASSGRRRAAIGAAFGVATVAVIWALLAVFGVHAALDARPGLRLLLQGLGGLYLVHVAARLWSAGMRRPDHEQQAVSGRGGYQIGFMTNILNPKAALFFGSVFATAFPSTPSVPLVAIAVAIVFLDALVWHLALAAVFSLPATRSRHARHGQWLTRGSSILVGLFGIGMVLASCAALATGAALAAVR